MPLEVLLLLLFLGTILLLPAFLLLLAWRRASERLYGPAQSLATAAGVFSWMFMGLEGLAMIPILLSGYPVWQNPWLSAALAYPVALWFYAKVLHRSIRRRIESESRVRWARISDAREAARAMQQVSDTGGIATPAGDGGSAARG